ncbi:hypothetical protein H9Q09_00900 [Aurantimonas sp. DM33-3]|uniref:hypothetical protein n=1 Tax=Aurantimonas sp. DM33-3 TaxID=2766955 RepID=UPI001651E756|nr:hypothetical protein [Aurantimonas sp. DM33-3]MBC6714742.1 hypothetical protein [Aurantimonas sp. DM33-3]
MSPVRAPTILFIDAASAAGWAFGPAGQAPRSGSFRWASVGASHGAISWGVIRWMQKFLAENKPDEVVYEKPMTPTQMGGKTNVATTRMLMGIPFAIEGICYGLGHRKLSELSVDSIRKHFIGRNVRGEEGKEKVWRKCVGLGWIDPESDDDLSLDRTDALAGWSYAETILAPRLATPVDDLVVAAEAKKRGKVFRP